MSQYIAVFLILAAGLCASCTKKKEPSPKLLELQKRVKVGEEELEALDAKIKAVPAKDLGLGVKLAGEKELAQARLDRLKLQFDATQKKEGLSLEGTAGEGEGGHGGGGHGSSGH